jgi:hypothetical protein
MRLQRAAFLILFTASLSQAAAPATRPFVIGMYAVPPQDRDMAALHEMGITHVHVYTLTGTTPERFDYAQNYLDLAHKHGLKVMFDFNGKKLSAHRDGLSELDAIVARFKDHPALDMWYLFDEPVGLTPPRKLRPFYDLLKAQSPNIPVATCFNHAEHWDEYAGVTDVILNDFYPVRGNPFPSSGLQIVTTFTHEALHTGRAVMPVIQCFNWACLAGKATTYRGFPVAELRYPNETELRYMIYGCVAQGVSGVFFYSYLRGRQYDPKWFDEVFTPAARDLRGFTDAVGGVRPRVYKVTQDFGIYMALWDCPAGRWLMLANGQGESRDLAESLDGRANAAKLLPFGHTRATDAALVDGRVKVHAGPWEVFVWRLEN